MKSTAELSVVTDLYQKSLIVIHPNEGFDIGLMNTHNHINIFANEAIEIFNLGEKNFITGTIELSNNCSHGKISINQKFWKKIGMPKKVKLYYESNKLLLAFV